MSPSLTKETSEVTASHVGVLGEKLLGIKAEISFAPLEFDHLDSLCAFLSYTYGQVIFGPTNTPTEIYSADGQKYTFHRTAFTGAPAIGVGVDQDRLGDVTITAYPKPISGVGGAEAIYSVAEGTFSPPTLTTSKILSIPFIAQYGDLSFELEAGTTITFELALTPRSCDRLGEFDQVFGGYKASLSLKPIGLTQAQWETLAKPQGEARRGGLLGAEYVDLVLRGEKTGDPLFTLACAYVKTSSLAFSAENSRFGEIAFSAAGDMGAGKFSIGTASDDITFTDSQA